MDGREVFLGAGGAGGPIGRRPRPRRISAAVTTPTLCLIVAPTAGTVVVRPHGVIDEYGSVSLAGILGDLFVGQPDLAVAVDLTNDDHLEPAVVEMFEAAAAVATNSGGTLSLRHPGDEIGAAVTAGGVARRFSAAVVPTKGVRSPIERATSRCDHPAGSALVDPDPATTGRSTAVPNLRCVQ
jgi:anti-anti-sigma regulatory factor